MKSKVILALVAVAFAGAAVAQEKIVNEIKWRQSAYGFAAWNMARIKSNVEVTYNKEEVIKAANASQAVANSCMGALYAAGTDKGTGWEKTRAKPEIWTEQEKLGKAAMAFVKEANEMAKVAAAGDAAASKAQFGKLGGTCKGCHDDFKIKL